MIRESLVVVIILIIVRQYRHQRLEWAKENRKDLYVVLENVWTEDEISQIKFGYNKF